VFNLLPNLNVAELIKAFAGNTIHKLLTLYFPFNLSGHTVICLYFENFYLNSSLVQ